MRTVAHCRGLSRQSALRWRGCRVRAPVRARVCNRNCRDSARQCAAVVAVWTDGVGKQGMVRRGGGPCGGRAGGCDSVCGRSGL